MLITYVTVLLKTLRNYQGSKERWLYISGLQCRISLCDFAGRCTQWFLLLILFIESHLHTLLYMRALTFQILSFLLFLKDNKAKMHRSMLSSLSIFIRVTDDQEHKPGTLAIRLGHQSFARQPDGNRHTVTKPRKHKRCATDTFWSLPVNQFQPF